MKKLPETARARFSKIEEISSSSPPYGASTSGAKSPFSDKCNTKFRRQSFRRSLSVFDVIAVYAAG